MSGFIKIRCRKCGTEMIVFSHASRNIRCPKDNELVVQSTGGKINIVNADIIQTYG
ncbi:MAG: hypothetical protein QW336_03115 [Candidatus Anstonellales archaeon]